MKNSLNRVFLHLSILQLAFCLFRKAKRAWTFDVEHRWSGPDPYLSPFILTFVRNKRRGGCILVFSLGFKVFETYEGGEEWDFWILKKKDTHKPWRGWVVATDLPLWQSELHQLVSEHPGSDRSVDRLTLSSSTRGLGVLARGAQPSLSGHVVVIGLQIKSSLRAGSARGLSGPALQKGRVRIWRCWARRGLLLLQNLWSERKPKSRLKRIQTSIYSSNPSRIRSLLPGALSLPTVSAEDERRRPFAHPSLPRKGAGCSSLFCRRNRRSFLREEDSDQRSGHSIAAKARPLGFCLQKEKGAKASRLAGEECPGAEL